MAKAAARAAVRAVGTARLVRLVKVIANVVRVWAREETAVMVTVAAELAAAAATSVVAAAGAQIPWTQRHNSAKLVGKCASCPRALRHTRHNTVGPQGRTTRAERWGT